MPSSPIIALLLSLATPLGAAAELSCRVIEVADGDSFACLTADHRLERIRLQAIDAPENGQPFGQHARQNLAALLLERLVTIALGAARSRRADSRQRLGEPAGLPCLRAYPRCRCRPARRRHGRVARRAGAADRAGARALPLRGARGAG